MGKALLGKLIVCVGILSIIFCLRWLCCTLYMRHYNEQTKPPDMSYPNWYEDMSSPNRHELP